MPLVESTYKPTFLFKNHHFNTVYKTLFYTVTTNYTRKRVPTPDHDFIDLDFSLVGSDTLVIAIHGLEGSSQSHYLVSAINFLNSQKIDCVALNFRGCSGVDNSQMYSYNSGKTDDVTLVIDYVLNHYSYKNILLLGYSMGGNISLKYMGEQDQIPAHVKGCIAISAPCDLQGSSTTLAKWHNSIYLNRFMKSLKEKTLLKLAKFPESSLNKEAILKAKTFEDFDNAVTAPLFNFKNAKDYWTKCSSNQYLKAINKPTLLINALDDSFLSKSCYPFKEAQNNQHFYLETPKYGGHVGFNSSYYGMNKHWSENRIFNFIEHIIS